MPENFKFSKRPLPQTEDLVIRAMVQDANGDAFYPLTFTRERIDYITEASKGVSGIALKNGAKISVSMPYEELERKIYFVDLSASPVLDLRPVTGSGVAAGAGVPSLTRVFKGSSDKGEKKPIVDKPLTIAVFARQEGEINFQMLSFLDTEVDWSSVEGGGSGRNGAYTLFPLKNRRGPFGESEIIIDMSRQAFMEMYAKAKMDGLDTLDLREQTRQRAPGGPKTGF